MNYKIETQLAQLGNRSEEVTGTVNPPVYFSTAYRHAGIGESTGYDYIRTGNPTREILENSIAKLERGTRGFAFSSGMAAIQNIFLLFEPGDEFIVTKDIYGGSYRLFENTFKKFGYSFTYIHSSDPQDYEEAITERTKAIFIESPTNPLMIKTDINGLATISKKHNLLLIVDNTFFTPMLQRPLESGADIVIHSATKFLGGHNDVLAGLVVAKDETMCEELSSIQNASGAVLSPFDSWLLLRGMKTLALRMRQHDHNANEIVKFLNNHPSIETVLYPGAGGMLSFKVHDENIIQTLLKKFEIVTFAESLGGTETFITYPATQTHMDIPEEIRTSYGVCNRLLRVSVGLEHIEDLISDFNQAFLNTLQEVNGDE
ncbi:methionine biosynthesis PLP-dependent protein [Bacillus solimangrovi]|uniref:Cystathionine gamma-synthase n=1 Tax=Bacillus solimangrovi TaxID=1305675 RepID=A0A1E5LF90_9BACI|nr:methionine biosynthesis PLP-dependent protein [Bacillus solimangrovi]OEH92749.1 cystathionine gamma-synthase [Bacillus solimangrovi]